LIVDRPTRPDADFRYRIFNANGAEVEQCGNGARCLVRFMHDKQLTDKPQIRLETAAGIIVPRLEANGDVTVNMGVPRFDPPDIPFSAALRALTYPLTVEGRVREISALSMGNPHAVQVVADICTAPVTTEGALIEHHSSFPRGVNAGYMQIIGRGRVKLRVFERGAGETLSCGSGACAAAVAGITRGLLDSPVWVNTRGGDLHIGWAGESEPVYMTGPAVTVFDGEINL
ncbi:MAG: diaminopimelate epimerase, partial [Burkholderiales bacterium]